MEQPGKRILVVAGPPIEYAITAPLKAAGHEIDVAAGATNAHALLEQDAVDLVLVDLRTLVDDDLDSVLERCGRSGRIPLLVLTEPATMNRAVRALEAGAENILLNPVDPKAIQLLVAVSLDKKRLGDEYRTLRGRLELEKSDQTAQPEPDSPCNESQNKIVPLKKALEKPERKIILQALKSYDYNRLETAKALRINRTTLYNKMKKLGLLNRKRSRKLKRSAAT